MKSRERLLILMLLECNNVEFLYNEALSVALSRLCLQRLLE